MTASRPARRTPPRDTSRTARLRVEYLEDRLVPSLAAADAVPGQLLIRFEPGVTRADVADFYADHGLSELDRFDFGPGLRLRLVATPTPQASALIPATPCRVRCWRISQAGCRHSLSDRGDRSGAGSKPCWAMTMRGCLRR